LYAVGPSVCKESVTVLWRNLWDIRSLLAIRSGATRVTIASGRITRSDGF
jgi:hypothetical protein